MAQLIHTYLDNVALPYISMASPTETRPHWVTGSNCIANIRGQLTRRPGFSEYTSDTVTGTVKRIFTWRRWGAGYYIMLSVQDGSQIKVYKLLIGTDTTFQLLSTATSTSVYPYDFDISNNYVFFGDGVDMWKYDGTTVTKWGIAKPAAAPTATPGTGSLSPTSGFRYRYAFGTDVHVGAISDESVSTGPQTSKHFTITGSTTTDTQVTQVYVFRTTDGGATYDQLPNSPVAYSGSWSVVDNATDQQLTNQDGPDLNQNLPPTPSRGVKFFANRLWTFKGDTVYFSNFEEQKMGLEEESFDILNKYRFGGEVTGLAVVQKSLIVLMASGFYRITGDSRDNFTRAPFIYRFGTNGPHNMSQDSRMFGWLDVSGTVWSTDGSSMQEVSLPIRPDTASIDQTVSSIAFHNAGIWRLLVVQDAGQDKMWVFDQDLGQWNVPWSIGGSAVYSGEVAPGDVRLLVARNGQILVFDPDQFEDAEEPYTAFVQTGLINMIPATATTPRDGLTGWGTCQMIGIERNEFAPYNVSISMDEDPVYATMTSIIDNKVDPAFRTQGVHLQTDWVYARQPSGFRVTVQLDWTNVSDQFKLYTLDVVSDPGMVGEF